MPDSFGGSNSLLVEILDMYFNFLGFICVVIWLGSLLKGYVMFEASSGKVVFSYSVFSAIECRGLFLVGERLIPEPAETVFLIPDSFMSGKLRDLLNVGLVCSLFSSLL